MTATATTRGPQRHQVRRERQLQRRWIPVPDLRRNDSKGNGAWPAEPPSAQRKATATTLDSGLRRNDSNGNSVTPET
jgi:hypothetical protein